MVSTLRRTALSEGARERDALSAMSTTTERSDIWNTYDGRNSVNLQAHVITETGVGE